MRDVYGGSDEQLDAERRIDRDLEREPVDRVGWPANTSSPPWRRALVENRRKSLEAAGVIQPPTKTGGAP